MSQTPGPVCNFRQCLSPAGCKGWSSAARKRASSDFEWPECLLGITSSLKAWPSTTWWNVFWKFADAIGIFGFDQMTTWLAMQQHECQERAWCNINKERAWYNFNKNIELGTLSVESLILSRNAKNCNCCRLLFDASSNLTQKHVAYVCNWPSFTYKSRYVSSSSL